MVFVFVFAFIYINFCKLLVRWLVWELDRSGYWNVVFLLFSEFLLIAMCFWLRVAGVLIAIVEHACLLHSSLYSGSFKTAAAMSPMSILPVLEGTPICGQL